MENDLLSENDLCLLLYLSAVPGPRTCLCSGWLCSQLTASTDWDQPSSVWAGWNRELVWPERLANCSGQNALHGKIKKMPARKKIWREKIWGDYFSVMVIMDEIALMQQRQSGWTCSTKLPKAIYFDLACVRRRREPKQIFQLIKSWTVVAAARSL